MLTPDDFAGRPYGGGTNQGMHVDFGAAIGGALLLMIGVLWGLFVAGFGILLFEVWQRRYRGATLLDMKADLAYWLTGVFTWGALCELGHVSGYAALWPWLPCIAFVVEYRRISQNIAGDRLMASRGRLIKIANRMARRNGVGQYVRDRMSMLSLGFLSVCFISAMTLSITGEFPYKVAMAVFLSIAWAAIILIMSGRNSIWEIVEDFIFSVGYGAVPAIMLFDEVMPGSPILSVNISVAAPMFAIIAAHITAGAIVRFFHGVDDV